MRPAPVLAPLPIDEALPALLAALAHRGCAVLQAPPGAGKTTRVPLSLLPAAWLGGRRILVLEPRRIAARAAARRMATTLGEPVGRTVGFRVRGETRVGATTRIEVITEGVLTRMLQHDPTLEGVGAVLFDEFHERSLQADLGLALCLESRALVRDDLRILVMSATLDGAATAALLGDAPLVTSAGRQFPVVVHHVARHAAQRIESAVASAVRRALDHEQGSVLAFLPGGAEIRRTCDLLDGGLPADVRVHPLYGDLSAEAQDAALAPPPAGQRKVVVATSIAETSLTIEGVRIVVDCGLSRVPRFSPRTGMSRLETVRVAQASATQRTGRAGRTSPGICIRLWSIDENAQLPARGTPEILDADLTALALDLAVIGVRDPATLRWLDPPPDAALAQGRELLRQLGALDGGDRITPHGHAMAAFGLHPRLAHMLLRGQELGAGATACLIAALVDERDVLRREGLSRDADLARRVGLAGGLAGVPPRSVDLDALRRVREQSRQLRSQLGVMAGEVADESATGWLVALAYPDRIAQRRDGEESRYLLRNGYGAQLAEPGVLAREEFLAVSDLDGRLPHSRIYLAAALARDDLLRVFADQIVREESISWRADAGIVAAVRRERLGAIVLRESSLRDVDDAAVARVLLDAIRRGDGAALPWSESARRVRDRIAYAHHVDVRWPDVSDRALIDAMEEWLLPRLGGLRRRSEIERLDLTSLLLDMLSWEQRRDLDVLAPTHVTVPTGSRIPVDYSDPDAPLIAVRVQELFGLAETPRVGGGGVALTLQLLSPAHRPVQVTRDLAGFWQSSYFEVRRELRGRYPKHEWPDDPMSATPTRRAKPRGT